MPKEPGRRRPRAAPREAAVAIVRELQAAGHTAYLAGGCVRDRLLGREPKDYDVATDARPEAVRRKFPKTRFVGEAFGVVLVQMQGRRIEVATFRTEWGYTDGRRPEHVDFSDAEHDARRRDFTINGLFEDPVTGKVIDLVGGREDLEARVVRAIGAPDERFGEDYLRMLRAVRFAAALGFRIERRTAAAIRRHAERLGVISRERTGQEVMAMLTGPRPVVAARLMQRLDLDAPALAEEHRVETLATLGRLQTPVAFPTALAAWALDRHLLPHLGTGDEAARHLAGQVSAWVGDQLPALLRRWRRALCLNNDHRDALRACLALLPEALSWPDLAVSRRKRLLASRDWPLTRSLLKALGPAGAGRLARTIEHQSRPLLAEGVAPAPLIDGNDLVRKGHEPGPLFSRVLDMVYDAQLEGAVRTRAEALRLLDDLP